jgi:hypothetical protein
MDVFEGQWTVKETGQYIGSMVYTIFKSGVPLRRRITLAPLDLLLVCLRSSLDLVSKTISCCSFSSISFILLSSMVIFLLRGVVTVGDYLTGISLLQ